MSKHEEEEEKEEDEEVRYTCVPIRVLHTNPDMCSERCTGYTEDGGCSLFRRPDGEDRRLEEDDDGSPCRCKGCRENETKLPGKSP